jgi:hypothetical protein
MFSTIFLMMYPAFSSLISRIADNKPEFCRLQKPIPQQKLRIRDRVKQHDIGQSLPEINSMVFSAPSLLELRVE